MSEMGESILRLPGQYSKGEGRLGRDMGETRENKPHAWYEILSRVQEEASKDGQHFLAYLIGLAMAHLRAVSSAEPARIGHDP